MTCGKERGHYHHHPLSVKSATKADGTFFFLQKHSAWLSRFNTYTSPVFLFHPHLSLSLSLSFSFTQRIGCFSLLLHYHRYILSSSLFSCSLVYIPPHLTLSPVNASTYSTHDTFQYPHISSFYHAYHFL